MASPKVRCRNFNHGRTNISIQYCPDCGERINASIHTRCDEAKHASRRKDRNTFCSDCGKRLAAVPLIQY